MTTRIELCVECDAMPQHSRGLCIGCYAAARRGGSLDEYPTNAFRDDPDSHIRWGFAHPELIGDIAIEYGYELRKIVE